MSFYSKNELKKFKTIKKSYIKMGYPAHVAEQYSYDHLYVDRRSSSVHLPSLKGSK